MGQACRRATALVNTRQNAETFAFDGKIEIEGKSRRSAENKQTFGLTGKLKLRGKLVKTLRDNKQTLSRDYNLCFDWLTCKMSAISLRIEH